MCEECNQKNPNVPENADKVLFAEDFVNYVLLQFMLPPLSSGIADYRSFIHNAFNKTVRVATNFICRRLERENFEEFEDFYKENRINEEAYMSYVTSMKNQYLSMGFNAQKLIHFCVKTTTMAIRFYFEGFDEGPVQAVQNIINVLEEFDMASGGWESLNVIASNYARIYKDLDETLTPDSGSDYEAGSESSSGSDNYPLVTDSAAIEEACEISENNAHAQVFQTLSPEFLASGPSDGEHSKASGSTLPSVEDTHDRKCDQTLHSSSFSGESSASASMYLQKTEDKRFINVQTEFLYSPSESSSEDEYFDASCSESLNVQTFRETGQEHRDPMQCEVESSGCNCFSDAGDGCAPDIFADCSAESSSIAFSGNENLASDCENKSRDTPLATPSNNDDFNTPSTESE